MADKILLEAGTNEMELLVFNIGETHFGLNVAKVREIISRVKIIAIPESPDSVEGSFQLRDNLLTLVNLGKHFNMIGEETGRGEGLIVIIEFSRETHGILVDSVDRIHRISWDKIEPPSEFLTNQSVPITGVVRLEEETILIADLESVFEEIFGKINAQEFDVQSGEVPVNDDVTKSKLLFAEDSGVIRNAVTSHLENNGFENLTVCPDGLQAWEAIEKDIEENKKLTFDLLITDIEMPQLDGLALTNRIKSNADLKQMPVIIFSSIVTDDNIKKGEEVGANRQITKFQGQELLKAISELILENRNK